LGIGLILPLAFWAGVMDTPIASTPGTSFINRRTLKLHGLYFKQECVR